MSDDDYEELYEEDRLESIFGKNYSEEDLIMYYEERENEY